MSTAKNLSTSWSRSYVPNILILEKNAQPKSGAKGDLIAKCADGKQFGKIPTCSKCGGGKLRFNRDNGTYKCPGYMEDTDFVNCSGSYQF